jgi:hypothetical protein
LWKPNGAVLTVLQTAAVLFHAEMDASASLIACSRLAVLSAVLLELLRSPEMNTIRTAAYAAVAAKILSLLAEVVMATTNAEVVMKISRIPNLAASFDTKYKARIELTRRVAARQTLMIRVALVMFRPLK